jgi:hypothetical protein
LGTDCGLDFNKSASLHFYLIILHPQRQTACESLMPEVFLRTLGACEKVRLVFYSRWVGTITACIAALRNTRRNIIGIYAPM